MTTEHLPLLALPELSLCLEIFICIAMNKYLSVRLYVVYMLIMLPRFIRSNNYRWHVTAGRSLYFNFLDEYGDLPTAKSSFCSGIWLYCYKKIKTYSKEHFQVVFIWWFTLLSMCLLLKESVFLKSKLKKSHALHGWLSKWNVVPVAQGWYNKRTTLNYTLLINSLWTWISITIILDSKGVWIII